MKPWPASLLSRRQLIRRVEFLVEQVQGLKMDAANANVMRLQAERDRDDWKASANRQRAHNETVSAQLEYLQARCERLSRSLGEPKAK